MEDGLQFTKACAMKDKKASKTSKDLDPKPKQYPFLLLIALSVLIVQGLWYSSQHVEDLPYSRFIELINQGKISQVSISESRIYGEFKEPQEKGKIQFTTIPLNDPALVPLLREKGITFKAEPKSPFWTNILSWIFPFLIFYWVAGFFLRGRMGNAPGGIFGMTHAKAKVYVEKDIKTTFADVAGVDEAKEELKEIVQFLEDPKTYSRLGGRAPKGILLVGPPGTGKTLTAKVLAHELKLPLHIVQLDRMVTKFMGETSAKLRQIFTLMQQEHGVYLFDEFDAIGGERAMDNDVGEMRRVLNSFLQFIEQDKSDSLIVAATNNPKLLDHALFRRFDDVLHYHAPTSDERQQLISNLLGVFRGAKFAWGKVLAISDGLSHAEIDVACRDAIKMAIMSDQNEIKASQLLDALNHRHSAYAGR